MHEEYTQAAFPILSGLFYALFISIFAVGIAITVFWICMIIDCVKYEPSTGNDKVVWLLIILFAHGLGALIYYFVRKVPRQKLLNRLPPPPG